MGCAWLITQSGQPYYFTGGLTGEAPAFGGAAALAGCDFSAETGGAAVLVVISVFAGGGVALSTVAGLAVAFCTAAFFVGGFLGI